MLYDLILFDCDGTLVDSHGFIVRCFEETFAACDLPCPEPDRLRSIIGLSLPIAFQELLDDDQSERIERLVVVYRDQYSALIKANAHDEQRLFDGMRPLLDKLQDQRIGLGVVTGKGQSGLRSVLEHHLLVNYFSTLQTADRHPPKPHPSMVLQAMLEMAAEPERTLVIGDSRYDIEMAVAADVSAIGVEWGSHDRRTLESAGARRVAGSCHELEFIIGL